MTVRQLRSVRTETPDGVYHIIIDEDEVARVSGFGEFRDLEKRLPEELRGAIIRPVVDHIYERYVKEYYLGNTTALDRIRRRQAGSEFQMKIWNEMSKIPYGKTMAYKQLAQAVDNPTAVRAVGTTCGRNRLILLVPCHRVLKSDGSIGSYLYGAKIKESLLRHEGAL